MVALARHGTAPHTQAVVVVVPSRAAVARAAQVEVETVEPRTLTARMAQPILAAAVVVLVAVLTLLALALTAAKVLSLFGTRSKGTALWPTSHK
jgi:hypothetical protein